MIFAAWSAAGLAALGWAWHGGQLVQILKELRRIASDHEERIRVLEGKR